MPITGSVRQQTISKSEVDYRALPALNYSMLKKYDEDPIRFFEEFKLGKKQRDKDTVSTTLGNVVHFYLLDCHGDETTFNHRVEDRFAFVDYEVGSAQVFVLCDKLYEVTEESLDEEGNLTSPMQERFEEAYRRITLVREKEKGREVQKYYKGKSIEQVWDDFEQKGQDYFNARLKSLGKTIVSPSQLEKGKFLSQFLLTDPITRGYFEGIIHTSFPVEWLYTEGPCDNTPCKSEIDLFKVDHRNRRIYLCDLKCNYDNEGFEFTYLKHYYYLQQAFYWLAARYHFSHIEEDYRDYEIVPMQFLVADTSVNNRRPLIYQCSERDLLVGLNGFNLGHKHYKGIHELMAELCWAEQTNTWNISKTAFDNKGIMKLNFNYE